METLADLANDHKFAKVSSAKILCSILNNIIKVQIYQFISPTVILQQICQSLHPPRFPSIRYKQGVRNNNKLIDQKMTIG